MSRAFLVVWSFIVAVVGLERLAWAEPTPTAKLVLVVANNRGAELGRAELHYADDDGAKYRALFRAAVKRPSDVQFLGRFDRDTARLFSEAPDGLPLKAVLEQKVALLAARRAELAREGHAVELVFIYAGHGDVDRGKGFVQLEDGAFTADDLAGLVKRIDATRAHVILDSCNSVFLVSPRKPGGRHVATGEDAVRALRERLPRVGVFLSTSSDGEVFEWSELGAGIFSHAVRSGLAGAADADGNGDVSYAELRAFVDVATSEVKNPRYRPKVFARGPDGDERVPLFQPRLAQGTRLPIQGPVRTTLRDADDIPWVDAHVEAGARIEVLVPSALESGGTQEVLDVSTGEPRVSSRQLLDGSAGAKEAVVAARGSTDLFRALFARPFGPKAFAAETASPVPSEAAAYGLSHDDVTRFQALLAGVADSERSRRHAGALAALGAGAVYGGIGALKLSQDGLSPQAGLGWAFVSGGAGAALAAPFIAFSSTPGEELREEFERELSKGVAPTVAVANAESRLFAVAKRERTYRLLGGVLFGVAFAGAGTAFTLNELRASPDADFRLLWGSSTLLSIVGVTTILQPTPIERLADVWHAEPARPRWTFAPIGPGGPGASFTATF